MALHTLLDMVDVESSRGRGGGGARRAAAGPASVSRRPPPFEEFLEANRTAVYRFLLASAGPDADDCFQDTFLSALRAYPRLRDGSNLRAWALAIATRKVIDSARARARRPVPVEDVDEEAAPAPAPSPAIDGRDPLWQALRALPPRQRAAVAHRFVLDLSYAEIAGALGSSEETARANVYQGLRKLRERLGNDDAFEE
jgi:RNA polymerase sigma factor (sigma-70 family)